MYIIKHIIADLISLRRAKRGFSIVVRFFTKKKQKILCVFLMFRPFKTCIQHGRVKNGSYKRRYNYYLTDHHHYLISKQTCKKCFKIKLGYYRSKFYTICISYFHSQDVEYIQKPNYCWLISKLDKVIQNKSGVVVVV